MTGQMFYLMILLGVDNHFDSLQMLVNNTYTHMISFGLWILFGIIMVFAKCRNKFWHQIIPLNWILLALITIGSSLSLAKLQNFFKTRRIFESLFLTTSSMVGTELYLLIKFRNAEILDGFSVRVSLLCSLITTIGGVFLLKCIPFE